MGSMTALFPRVQHIDDPELTKFLIGSIDVRIAVNSRRYARVVLQLLRSNHISIFSAPTISDRPLGRGRERQRAL